MDTGRVPVVGVDVPGVGEVGQMIITRGASAGARFTISEELTRIGRDPRSEIFLDDITVSRNHAEVRHEPAGQYSLSDLGSLNGTYLDGERITHALLREGAQVQVGKFRFVFVIGTPGGAA
ncbi:MAG: FHA domain-containing protein [Microthrixaceae bacterium]